MKMIGCVMFFHGVGFENECHVFVLRRFTGSLSRNCKLSRFLWR